MANFIIYLVVFGPLFAALIICALWGVQQLLVYHLLIRAVISFVVLLVVAWVAFYCWAQKINAADARDEKFKAWLDEFEAIASAWDKLAAGNLPYSLPLDRSEGNSNLLCWCDMFDEGMSPQEAFLEDQRYWGHAEVER